MNKLTLTILLGALVLAAGWAGAATSTGPEQTALDAGTLAPGVYDVTFRLQVDRLAQSVTPLAALQVDVPGYPAVALQQITPISFTAAETPTDFVLRFDNWTNQNVKAEVNLKKNDAAAAAPALIVEKITLAPVTTPTLGTIWPGKILYYTKENAEGNVAVYNGTAQPQALTLKLALESDLDQTRPLATVPVKLAPGERQEFPVTWNTGTEEWGFALVATLLDAGGRSLDEGREYFSVADNLWAVGIRQLGRGTSPPYRYGGCGPISDIQEQEKQFQQVLASPAPRAYWNYSNYEDFYAWAPEDFFGLAPAHDYWCSGTGCYTMGKRLLQMMIEWLHRKGMRAVGYTNPFVCGFGSEKIIARHPEWFVHDAQGQLTLPCYYEKKLEVGEALTQGNPWLLQCSPYACCANVNPARLDAIEQQVQALVKSHYMFGWDGVRFDNGFYSAFGCDWQGRSITGGDPAKKNALEAGAWEYLRAQLLKDLGPRYAVGSNCDYAVRDTFPAAWDADCRNGGLLMEEGPRDSWRPISVNNRWVDYVACYHHSGEIVRGLGGHHLTIGLDSHFPVDHLYLNVLTYVDRTHPYANVNSDELPLGSYARFLTRYSALYWDVNRVKMLPQAEQRVKVDSPAPVWWQNYAYLRQTPQGRRQYLINLINPPVQERIYSDPTNQVPAPQQNVKVTLTLAPGEQITKSFLLSADPAMTKTALPLSRQGATVSVTVPLLYFWSLVVFE